MRGLFSRIVLAGLALALAGSLPFGLSAEALAKAEASVKESASQPKKATVFVIPVRDEITDPAFYILRRGLKEAIAQKADLVVLDMQTLGGAADTALDMMDALSKYPGATLTYVNNQAMSAGAFIAAATQEIWFSPDGIIGAAAAVTSQGQDIPETMRLKLTSFLRAKIRAISEGRGYRGDVLAAMIDKDYELKIGDKVIKPKGELLSLTATEASKTYGNPPEPLLAAGIAKNLDDLLAKKFDGRGWEVTRLEVTWSERLAVWLNAISPVLLGLGLLALFIEFKTPGFGVFGIVGLALIGIVFLGHFIAGFSGHEPILIFGLGAILLFLELIFFHSAGFLGVVGFLLMMGSVVWSMADIWPNRPVTLSSDLFLAPLLNLALGCAIAVALALALARFLPRGWMWDRLVLSATVGSAAQQAGAAPDAALDGLIGRRGVAATALRPGGQIEIGGRRYEAMIAVGALDAGTPVIVTGRADFNLIVEKAEA